MEKKTLYFKADNQSLVGQNVPARFASDTVSYIEAVFDLGENWSGFDVVKAVWSTDFESVCTVLDSSGACVVPWEVLERVGDVCVNLVGSISENDSLTDRLTTYPVKAITVDANAAICGSETGPITPSQFDQFVEAVRADADRSEDGATAAAASASEAATSAAWSDERATDSSNAAYLSTTARAEAERWANEAKNAQYYAWQEADNAATSARDAESAKQTILNMTATAQTLPEGSEATVNYSNGVMAFGIPKGDTGARGAKGDTGETGATPQMSIGAVETLAPDEDATATITGTAENPVLNLGLPKGDTGEVSLLELIANTKVDEKTDSVPYQMRTLSGVGSHESLRKIVGGTVAWNQLFSDADASYSDSGITFTISQGCRIDYSGTFTGSTTYVNAYLGMALIPNKITVGHKYLIKVTDESDKSYFVINNPYIESSQYIYAPTAKPTYFHVRRRVTNDETISGTIYVNIFDLTQMFGSTIADYIYSLEQATAGAGVALFKALFPEDWYPYDEGTLKSVQTSAHKTYDGDGNVIGNYPLDSSLTLRGILKLDASNNLYYDGDEYEADGMVNRRYGIVDLGTLDWVLVGQYFRTDYFSTVMKRPPNNNTRANAICPRYTVIPWNQDGDKVIGFSSGTDRLVIGDSAYEDAASFKASLNGVYMVYELATPTTEEADPYTEIQSIESGGTEEFVGAEIPVGHESVYPRTLADTMPTSDGSYTLSLTVSGGKPSVEWEVNA